MNVKKDLVFLERMHIPHFLSDQRFKLIHEKQHNAHHAILHGLCYCLLVLLLFKCYKIVLILTDNAKTNLSKNLAQ